jgi:hypothetical protein
MVPVFVLALAFYASLEASPLAASPDEAAPAAPVAAAAPERVCLSAAETRAAVARHGLVDPLAALRAAARKAQADPLRSRLCRVGAGFVYEMALLRRDGKVLRVNVDAATGQPAGRN